MHAIGVVEIASWEIKHGVELWIIRALLNALR